MKIPKKSNFITNEVYWLSQNERFQKDLDIFRDKYEISLGKIYDLNSYFRWSKELSPEKHIEFEADFLNLARKCRSYHSRHTVDFVNTLRMFVLTNRLGVIHDNPSHAIPLVVLNTENDGIIEIEITIHHFDTGIEEAIDELRNLWKKKIKPFQRKLSTQKRLSKETKFRAKVLIWEKFNQGKSATDISEEMKNTNYTQQDTSDILRNISKKIDKTYN